MWMWELVGVLDNPSVSKAKDKDPGFKARRLESGREPMGGPDHTAPAPALVVVYQHRHRHLAGIRPSLRAKGTFKAVELYLRGCLYNIRRLLFGSLESVSKRFHRDADIRYCTELYDMICLMLSKSSNRSPISGTIPRLSPQK